MLKRAAKDNIAGYAKHPIVPLLAYVCTAYAVQSVVVLAAKKRSGVCNLDG